MHERWLISVKVERRLTSRLSSALFILPLFYLRDYNLRAVTCAGKDTSVKITNQTSPQASNVPFSKRKGQGTRLIQEDKARVLSAKTDYPTTLMLQVVYTSMFHMKIYSPHTDWRTSFKTFYKREVKRHIYGKRESIPRDQVPHYLLFTVHYFFT